MLDEFIRLNGVIDLITVMVHVRLGISWWSPIGVSDGYVCFAPLYGFIKVVCGMSYLTLIAYALEVLYYSRYG